VLELAVVADDHDDGTAAKAYEPATQLVLDGHAKGRVHEATVVEEDDDRERVLGQRACEEVKDG
jgi:hypothetical protein